MKFITSWTIPPATTNAAIARFLETGGAAPEGVKILGRWHGANGQGFAISESTDGKAVYQWAAQWSDLLVLTVTPCLEDADAGAAIAHCVRRRALGRSGNTYFGEQGLPLIVTVKFEDISVLSDPWGD